MAIHCFEVKNGKMKKIAVPAILGIGRTKKRKPAKRKKARR